MMDANTVSFTKHTRKESMGLPYILLLIYIVVEYARPAFLSPIRPALIVQIVLMVCLLKEKKRVAQIVKDKYFKIYLFLIVFMIFHIFFAKNNYWAYMHFQTILSYLLVGISFCVFLDSVEKFKGFLSFLVIVMAVCALDRLLGARLLGGSGHLGDENDFAMAMNCVLPISFFLGKSENGLKKWLFGVASILLVLGTMISASRGGFLSLVAVGGGCLVYSKHKLKTFLAIAVLAILAWTFATPEYREEILGIGVESADSDTGKDRIELWKVSWRAFLENPILGVGQGNMPIVMETYQYDDAGESFWQRGLWGRAIHSVYFTVLPELGLVGVFLMGSMFRILLQKSRKIRQLCDSEKSGDDVRKIEDLNVALMVGIFGFLVAGIFLSALYYPEYWNMSSLILALLLIASKTKSEEQSRLASEKPAI
jgi:O-antigen ligase